MRWLAIVILVLVVALGGAYFYFKDYPYRKYAHWMKGEEYNLYYQISGYKAFYLKPPGLEEIPPYKEDYIQLWKEFPLRNSIVPLPTRHPMFQSIPIIDLRGKTVAPQLGVILHDAKGREISRVYTLPNRLYQDQSQGQELFKLPYVRNRLLNKGLNQIWKDIFSYEILVKPKTNDEMIYDLYILHLRSKMLPPETVRYGLIKEGKQALIELTSQDKDYMVELVLTQDSGSIFSYIIKTEKENLESRKIRAKFLETITFSPVDEDIGRLLYTEFKQLNYARQIDQEGMLYLFSAWSQQPENVDLLKEMIYYLERGDNTKKQLAALYAFAFKKYGKTFTSRKDVMETDDPELALQRKIEIEERENRKAAEENKGKAPPAPELTPDEKMNIYLKKAKEDKAKPVEDMTVY
jgi:hypothetical protein